jgi:4-amino-4-deoxy-L-arabinose transferase-like glycosyltransferase
MRLARHTSDRAEARPASAAFPWRRLFAWVALALLVRGGAALVLGDVLGRADAAGIAHDGVIAYLPLAQSFLAGHGLALEPGQPVASHVPGYPLILSAALGFVGSPAAAVLLIQVLAGSLVVGAIFALATLLVNERVGHIAALLAVAFPDLVVYSLLNLSESPHLLLVGLASLCVLGVLRTGRRDLSLALGAALGAALMVREGTLFVLVLWGALLAYAALRQGAVPRSAPLLLGLGVLAFVVPWWIRNYSTFGEFIPLTSKGASNLYQGTMIRPYPVTDYRNSLVDMDPERVARDRAVHRRANAAPTRQERDRILIAGAVANLRADPAGQLLHVGRKLTWLWAPNVGPRHASRIGAPVLLWGVAAVHFAVLGLGLVGLVLVRRRREVLYLLLLPTVLTTAFHMVIGGAEPRYHFSCWPALLIGTAIALDGLLTRAEPALRALYAAPVHARLRALAAQPRAARAPRPAPLGGAAVSRIAPALPSGTAASPRSRVA